MASLTILICIGTLAALSTVNTVHQYNYSKAGLMLSRSPVYDTIGDPADTTIYESPEIPAEFTKKMTWREFLVRNLKATTPVDNGAPEGVYHVIIMFVVNKDGSVERFKPITNHGYGMEDETIRVLKLTPNWQPAKINNKPVRAFHFQKMTFLVTSA